MENDVILNKITVIERCHTRIKDVYAGDPNNLTDFTKQDSIVLNIQRACEACIYLAMHVSAEKKFGLPQKSREAFELLHTNNVITEETVTNMKSMVGFRNIAVHDYQAINAKILEKIIEHHLDDFISFTKQILAY
ncbi:type VII toxin-antitoxin system HepT family RNase toxin [Sporosarcina sp. YIM B06819]|uniref:type VII toxin-antitoxin system HepT family RNase toxin n=1 Tax=Sporosarcina sp. YIM B06819 TaxID=3081769 RepID=UPI00298CEB90|nr:DUF86 domain-containing protein [Sporosarcina sp. YIM B06819]